MTLVNGEIRCNTAGQPFFQTFASDYDWSYNYTDALGLYAIGWVPGELRLVLVGGTYYLALANASGNAYRTSSPLVPSAVVPPFSPWSGVFGEICKCQYFVGPTYAGPGIAVCMGGNTWYRCAPNYFSGG